MWVKNNIMLHTDFILFSMGGVGVSLLELFSVIVGLLCVFFAGRAKKINFWFGYIYCVLLFVLFMQKHLYSSMMLQPISLLINIVGHYRWTHPKKGEENKNKELKITTMSGRIRWFCFALIVLLSFIWGWMLREVGHIWPDAFPPATRPFLDAFVTMVILTAQYLSAQKKIECWGAWTVVNVTNVILYISAGLIFMPIVSASYLVLAFFGFSSWKKQIKSQEDVNN